MIDLCRLTDEQMASRPNTAIRSKEYSRIRRIFGGEYNHSDTAPSSNQPAFEFWRQKKRKWRELYRSARAGQLISTLRLWNSHLNYRGQHGVQGAEF